MLDVTPAKVQTKLGVQPMEVQTNLDAKPREVQTKLGAQPMEVLTNLDAKPREAQSNLDTKSEVYSMLAEPPPIQKPDEAAVKVQEKSKDKKTLRKERTSQSK